MRIGILSDTARLDKAKVAEITCAVSGVKACKDVRSRGMEGSVYVDLSSNSNVVIQPSVDAPGETESGPKATPIVGAVKSVLPTGAVPDKTPSRYTEMAAEAPPSVGRASRISKWRHLPISAVKVSGKVFPTVEG